ncbi:Two component regulator three Y domain-containing protein [Bacillus swezeyi]|uniref:accessory Sec system protein Asp2 n=1 Tax=Bacillus swezeyi TaxID=1925020 RepID=UPI002E1BA335|nr:Two component regulator three Y domain-containing protein [Bacillus swezeyi]
MIKGEAVFKGEIPVKHLFKKGENSDVLAVVFSGFSTEGKPPLYNYIRTLEGFTCNTLFILDDFGCRGSYYLCKQRDFSIERSVISLINKISEENGVKKIISCGSSKGGYASLYYAIKYDFDAAICGSPQYYLGDYLISTKNQSMNEVAKFMSGGCTQNDKHFLNNLLRDIILNSKNTPEIYIHLGEGEIHYTHHVKPMIEDLKSSGRDYTLDLGAYSSHADVAKFFPEFLRKNIADKLKSPYVLFEEQAKSDMTKGDSYIFRVNRDREGDVYAWYIYKDGEIVERRMYEDTRETLVSFYDTGDYMVKVFVRNKDKRKTSLKSVPIKVKEALS